MGGRYGPPVRSRTVRTGASLNDADPVRVVLVERKQRLLGSHHAVGVSFSVVAEQAHGDPLRDGANRPVVAGEIVGVANFAGLTRAADQLLDLAALAGVEGWLVSVEGRIERHDSPIYLIDATPQRAALCTALSRSRGICKLPRYACSSTSQNACYRCRENKGRSELLGAGPLVSLVFVH